MSNCSWKQLRYDLRLSGAIDKIRCTFVRRAFMVGVLPVAFVLGAVAYVIFGVMELAYDLYTYFIKPCWFGTYRDDADS